MKHKIFIVVGLLVLSSCMKLKKKEAEESQPVAPPAIPIQTQVKNEIRVVNENKEFSYYYENDMSVSFLAPNNWPAQIFVQKNELGRMSDLNVVFDPSGKWSDEIVGENKVTYSFFAKMGSENVLLEQVEVLPVLDLVIDEDVNLSQKFQLNNKTKMILFKNLTISFQKKLLIENYSGKIVIENLNSRSGFLQTFPISLRAADGQSGRNGGVIDLHIKNGSGDLSVIMKGENGGNGLSAKEPDAHLKGAAGARGTPAVFVKFVLGCEVPFPGPLELFVQ